MCGPYCHCSWSLLQSGTKTILLTAISLKSKAVKLFHSINNLILSSRLYAWSLVLLTTMTFPIFVQQNLISTVQTSFVNCHSLTLLTQSRLITTSSVLLYISLHYSFFTCFTLYVCNLFNFEFFYFYLLNDIFAFIINISNLVYLSLAEWA